MYINPDVLAPVATTFLANSNLTPAERAEVLRIAQGFACKDSAAAANISPETIRARRKRMYRKLGVGGSNELISSMLAFALRMLARGDSLDLAAAPDGPNPAAQAEAAAENV